MRTGLHARTAMVVGFSAILLAGCYISSDGCHIGGDTFKAKFSRTENLTAPLTDITALDVTTSVGKIRLEAAEVAEAQIVADIQVKARDEDKAQELAEQVRIVAEPSGRTLVIKAIKPPDFGRNQLSVDLTITAPAGLALDCTTNVGDIRVDGFTKRVDAHTDVGTITCEGLRDAIDLHTNVGDVRAAYASDAPAALSVAIGTNVGAIEFSGPKDISAKLTAKANVGSIDSDRPITVSGSLGQSIRASLGTAEGQVHLNTNVGSIKIR